MSFFISAFSERVVWGPPMLLALLSFGIYLTVRTGFFPLRRAGLIAKKTVGSLGKKQKSMAERDPHAISPLQAVSTALAATIGTGNIAGVATAITLGGPGAVFWMWVSALFGMMTAFGEHTLGLCYRRRGPLGEWLGGPMYYLEDGLAKKKGLSRLAKPLAYAFAVCCILASFGMGNMIQINTAAKLLETGFTPLLGIRVPPLATGMLSAFLLGLLLLGGTKRIGQVAERLVPAMALFYLCGTLLVIGKNIHTLPAVFSAILRSAFGLKALGGGVTGALLLRALSVGVRRGVFSNEAGLGSSVLAGAAADLKEPVEQGMWGIFTVFFDTIVGCSLTAFTILSAGVVDLTTGAPRTDAVGAALVSRAFETTLHPAAGVFITLSTLFFALSTVIGWSFFGNRAVQYLFGTAGQRLYPYFYMAAALLGAVYEPELVWALSDCVNGLMAVPNLIGLWALSDEILAQIKTYCNRRKTHK